MLMSTIRSKENLTGADGIRYELTDQRPKRFRAYLQGTHDWRHLNKLEQYSENS